MKSSYQKLLVWQKAMELVVMTYKLTADFPKEELYCLKSQMHRSAISIPSNIAEGSQKDGRKDFDHFLRIAKSSSAELETQLLLAQKLMYVKKSTLFEKCLSKLIEIRKMISGLRSTL